MYGIREDSPLLFELQLQRNINVERSDGKIPSHLQPTQKLIRVVMKMVVLYILLMLNYILLPQS